jgi:hypothetical protein
MTQDEQQPQTRAPIRRDATDSAYKYWRGQVWPRKGRLLKDKGLWWSLVAALGLTVVIGHLPAADTPINEAASALMDYSAIGLGACITALVLALGLAPQARVEIWATKYVKGTEYSAFSELVFVMSWAASTQLLAAAVAWTVKLVGADVDLMPNDPLASHVALFFGAIAAVIYALWHLCTVIATLSMIAAVTIREAQEVARRRTETEQVNASGDGQ